MSIYEFDAKKHEDWIRKESFDEGFEKGELDHLIAQVIIKMKKNKELPVIIEELESDEAEIRPIYDAVQKYGTNLMPEAIREKMNEALREA